MASKGGGKSSKILGENFDAKKYSFQTLNPSEGPDFPRQRPRSRDTKHKRCGKWALLIQIVVGLLLLGIGIIIGYFCREAELKDCHDKEIPVALKWSPTKFEALQNEILNSDGEVKHHAHSSLNQIVISGSAEDESATQFIYDTFRYLNFDHYEKMNFSVMLSFPKEDNVVHINGKNESFLHSPPIKEGNKKSTKMKREQKSHLPHSKTHEAELKFHPFVANSKAGSAEGEVIYINYGHPEDYGFLTKNNVSAMNRIALIRLGRITINEKLYVASKYGISAVLLYHDPPLQTPYNGDEETAPFLTLNIGGDVQGTGVLSLADTAIPYNWTNNPLLPLAQPISRKVARSILFQLSKPLAPSEWVGSFNIPYAIGKKDNSELSVSVKVTNTFQRHLIQSVCGTIVGIMEPDRFVLLGANPNSFNRQSFEMMAPFLSLADDLSQLKRKNWAPWRTIKLCSWGGSEFGNLGVTEWIKAHHHELFHKAVAYIHLETSSEKLSLTTTPEFKSLLAKLKHEIKTLHDPKLNAFKGLNKDPSKGISIYPAEDTSQQILNNIGIPTISIKGMSNPHYNDSTLGHLGTLFLLSLADADLLPLDIHDYSLFIYMRIKESCLNHTGYIDHDLKAKLLGLAEKLLKISDEKNLNTHHKHDGMSAMEKESLNNLRVSFGRSFLDQSPANYRWRHLLSGAVDPFGFPTLNEALNNFSDKDTIFRHQISLIINALNNAINTLKASHV